MDAATFWLNAAWAAAAAAAAWGLALLDQLLDVGVDARQSRLVLAGQGVGLALRRGQAVARRLGLVLLLLEARLAGGQCAWAVCSRSIVEVTLPVAIDEYSERIPLVLTFDVKIWVAVFEVPEFV